MVNFIQNFRLWRIIITMEALKCSWTIICEAKPKNWLRDTREELVCPRKKVREKLLIFCKSIYPCPIQSQLSNNAGANQFSLI